MKSPLLAKEIRAEFLSFFKKQGHTVVESSPLVPHNDPTLLFTSAGMVQFKDCFLGTEKRPYTRAATAQKCLRAGGKHNDLERVGFTARHHTFFEMLGNFSFGDYFKKEAIHFAWEFVTKNLGLPKNRLYVTVFETDDEAADLWHKQEGIPRDRIYRFGEKDNFWAAGDVGPCGPCSEIFVDRGEKYGTSPEDVMGGDGDRFMEIWNLVFMQYHRGPDGKLNPLAKPSIDTGAGLERLASVLQDVATNYDIDLFQNLIHSIAEFSKKKYGKNHDADVSMRVLADHCRATNFLMTDGVLPSNEGRGYVLRRIMRRAIRHGRNLGLKEPFFWRLTKPLIDEMGAVYPELKDKREFLETNIRLEEERFLTTLEHGLKLLDEATQSSSKTISGDMAFKLYDTYGFPLDLTQVIATERGFTVDEKGFESAMSQQRERSREHWKGSGEESVDTVYKQLQQKNLTTKFLGYDTFSASGKILAIIENSTEQKTSHGLKFQVVVNQTPFYAESGGQVGDQGSLTGPHGFHAQVTDVQKPFGNFIVLFCDKAHGKLTLGDTIEQSTHERTRRLTAKNHTATHMLHHGLRKFLGNHVKQAGSLVTPELLRFDFTHTQALSDADIQKIENFINESILRAELVGSEEMSKDKALTKGAIAFFGDKYGDHVRVISVGDYSVELCGGTHVRNTADIQSFKILSESGIAAGVRRIVAVTGPKIIDILRDKEHILNQLMDLTKASAPEELVPKLEKLLASEKELRRSVENQSRKAASSQVDQWIAKAQIFGAAKFICGIMPTTDADNATQLIRDLSDTIRSKVSNSIIALGAHDKVKNQALLLVAVTKDLQSKFSAGDLVKQVAPVIDGRGGGKPDLAQAGGKHPEKLPEAFKALADLLKKEQ